jgi:hypothetical protein
MIALTEYVDAVLAETGIDITPGNDEAKQQRTVVTAPIGESLFVVLGLVRGRRPRRRFEF